MTVLEENVPKPTSSIPKPTSAIDRATAKSAARFPSAKSRENQTTNNSTDIRLADPQVERHHVVSRSSNMEMYNPPHAHAHNYLEYSKDQLLLYGEETETEKRWKRENPEGTMDEYLEYLNRMSEIVTPGCSERSKYRHFGADDREARAYGRRLLSNMSDNRSRSVPTRRREPSEDPEMDQQEPGAYVAMDEDEEESHEDEPTYNRSSSSWQDT